MREDITYCVAECANKKNCRRDPRRIRDQIPHSFADFRDTCPDYSPCKFARKEDRWECTCYRKTYCADQEFDYNPDGSINAVFCGWVKRSLE